MSKHLNSWQLAGLNKIGDVILPGEGDFKSFSDSGCGSEVDRILDHMPATDRNDLKLLLLLLGILPFFAVSWFVALLEKSRAMPDWAGSMLRFIRLGVRGLITTLYYSHPHAHSVLGYEVSVFTDDLRPAKGQVDDYPKFQPSPR